MSAIQKELFLRAPEHVSEYRRREHFVSGGHECPTCGGSGRLLRERVGGVESVRCGTCGGSGRLRAEVTVVWEGESEEGGAGRNERDWSNENNLKQ